MSENIANNECLLSDFYPEFLPNEVKVKTKVKTHNVGDEGFLWDFYPDFLSNNREQSVSSEGFLWDFYPEFLPSNKQIIKRPKRYGISYMGSKSIIAKQLIAKMPKAKYFIDLFAGGCAMTHCAMLSGKYESFVANDIGDAPSLFQKAINGEFKDENRWISREDFMNLKSIEPYVRYCWSFGNQGINYLYSKEIEPYKKAYFFASLGDFRLFDEFAPYAKEQCRDNLRLYIKYNEGKIRADYMRWYIKTQLNMQETELKATLNALNTLNSAGFLVGLKKVENLESIERLERLQNLERLERLRELENLKNFENLEIHQKCYKKVELPESSECVVYCDPPYRNTTKYVSGDFNHNEFYDFCENLARRGYKVFISEYEMPSDRFQSVFSIKKRQTLNNMGVKKQEHLFLPKE